MDIVSRTWITTLLTPEESSTQVEVCFLDAIRAGGLTELLHDRVCRDSDGTHTSCYEQLRQAVLSSTSGQLDIAMDAGLRPTYPQVLTFPPRRGLISLNSTRFGAFCMHCLSY